MLGGAGPLRARPAVEKAKRIVFLGDSITYSGHYVTCFEAWLTLAHPDSERLVINFGLPSETVSGLSEEGHAGGSFPRPDLHERLERVLEAGRPDYVFACYGINCGIYQPASPERLAAFQSGMTRLHEAVTKRGAVIVHITPWPYDHHTGRIPVLQKFLSGRFPLPLAAHSIYYSTSNRYYTSSRKFPRRERR